MNYISLRQSDDWEKYLEFLKWTVLKTSSGIKVSVMKTPLGSISKIQRPYSMTKKDLDEMEKLCTDRKCIFIKIEPGYGQDEKQLVNRGYVKSSFPLSPPSTMFIELTKSKEELWGNISGSGKYSINRARREGSAVKFHQKPTKKQLESFYAVAKQTSKRGKFYIQPFKDVLKKRDIFKDNSYLIEVYDKKGNLTGAKYFLGSEGLVTFIHGGTSDLGRRGKGGYLLMWESILYFKKLGYGLMDLEGVDDERFPLFTRNWGGFTHFKEKFGGKVLRLPPPYIKYYNPLLKFLAKYHTLPL